MCFWHPYRAARPAAWPRRPKTREMTFSVRPLRQRSATAAGKNDDGASLERQFVVRDIFSCLENMRQIISPECRMEKKCHIKELNDFLWCDITKMSRKLNANETAVCTNLHRVFETFWNVTSQKVIYFFDVTIFFPCDNLGKLFASCFHDNWKCLEPQIVVLNGIFTQHHGSPSVIQQQQ